MVGAAIPVVAVMMLSMSLGHPVEELIDAVTQGVLELLKQRVLTVCGGLCVRVQLLQ
jgi:hypothetical protein